MNFLKSLFLILPFLLFSCSSDDEPAKLSFSFVVDEGGKELLINNAECGISTTGEQQTIHITLLGNYDAFHIVSAAPEWISVSKSDAGITFSLQRYEGSDEDMRSADFQITVSKGSMRERGRIIIHQHALSVEPEEPEEPELPGVYLLFETAAEWQTFGVNAPITYRYFSVEKRLPSRFPFTPEMATGIGGILLIGDSRGQAVALDAVCPVENDPRTIVHMSADTGDGVCVKCDSHFDMYYNPGVPTSGKAAQKELTLTTYRITPNGKGGYVVSR